MSSDLVIHADQTYWSERQLAALHQIGADRAAPADLAVFFHQAQRTGLDPFARQIHLITRDGKPTIQTGIDGFRLVARRATEAHNGTLGYQDVLWCGDDGQWRDVWLATAPPAAAKATVIRDGQPISAVALYREYVARRRDGQPNRFWAEKPALMLAKCAEALALRKAFPLDLSGLYTTDEMQAADNPPPDTYTVQQEQPGAAAPTPTPPTRPPGNGSTTRAARKRPTSGSPRPPRVGIRPDQSARLATLMAKTRMSRQDALQWASDVTGRDVPSAADLTESEADHVIQSMECLLRAEKEAASEQPVLDAELVDDPPAPDPQDDMGSLQ